MLFSLFPYPPVHPKPSHVVQWHVPNDVPQCVSICASYGFLNFSNILLPFISNSLCYSPSSHMFPPPTNVLKNFSHDICFAKQELGQQTGSKEWGLCVGYRGMWAETEKGLQRIHSENKQVLGINDHADGKSFYALVVLEAWACRLATAGYDELLDYAHKHRSMLAPLRQCNAMQCKRPPSVTERV